MGFFGFTMKVIRPPLTALLHARLDREILGSVNIIMLLFFTLKYRSQHVALLYVSRFIQHLIACVMGRLF